MSVMRAIKVKEIYKSWFKTITKFTLPSISLKPLLIEYEKDVCQGISAKKCSRDERGQSETRVYLQSSEQNMLSNKEWLAFFHNFKNKQHHNLSLSWWFCIAKSTANTG